MHLNQLHTTVQIIVQALDKSELAKAILSYQTAASGGATGDDSALLRAANIYMDKAAEYGQAELAVAESLHLLPLQSPSFWFDATSHTLDAGLRAAMLAENLKNIQFSCARFPKIFELLQRAGLADPDINVEEQATITLRIHDATDKASDPDRISRLIDGVDLIYRACANLAELPVGGLSLMSVTGNSYRTVVFSGHREVSTATRRIIRSLHLRASGTLQSENYSVEEIAEQLPFMHAMGELFRVKALDAGLANEIREEAFAGAVMLLECGARIYSNNHVVEGLAEASL